MWCTPISGALTCSVDAGREERIKYLETELARREGEAQRANSFYQGQVAEFELQIQRLQEDIARWGWGGVRCVIYFVCMLHVPLYAQLHIPGTNAQCNVHLYIEVCQK